MEEKKKQSKKKYFVIIIVIIAIILMRISCSEDENSSSNINSDSLKYLDTNAIDTTAIDSTLDTLSADTTLMVKDTLIDSSKIKDSLKNLIKKPKKNIPKKNDSIINIDSVKVEEVADSTAPEVYLNPPAGLYKENIKISVICDEPKCKSFYSINSGTFENYASSILLEDSCKVSYFALDSVGNSSDTLMGEYHISKEVNPCEKNMIYLKNKNVCIDTYEWPNIRGKNPDNFVSLYSAMDSCSSVGKRLCSEDEWIEAAGGNISKYPYGSSYSRRKCNTESGKRAPSGSYPQCRSYYGAYDMTGNLSEWTSTEDENNPSYNRVYGGNFSSTSTASNKSFTFSYFPTNKYVGVGFRCCKENK